MRSKRGVESPAFSIRLLLSDSYLDCFGEESSGINVSTTKNKSIFSELSKYPSPLILCFETRPTVAIPGNGAGGRTPRATIKIFLREIADTSKYHLIYDSTLHNCNLLLISSKCIDFCVFHHLSFNIHCLHIISCVK